MTSLDHLFANNRAWADRIRQQDPQFFEKLSKQQTPEFLWIGCSDSRVPANQITDLMPGDVFVHRNIANQVIHTDLNCLSVMQFAVQHLLVKHIIVCGHYGCGGVKAAYRRDKLGMVDNWLRHVQDVREKHEALFAGKSEEEACQSLVELNVIEQVMHVTESSIVQEAWARGQELRVHGWAYGIADGLLRNLNVTVSGPNEVSPAYQRALASLAS